MEYIAKLTKLKGKELSFESLEEINIERLKTVFGTSDNVEGLITFKDKRALSDRQRKLYRALLNNIYEWSGEPTDFLHEWFKEIYFLEKGETISTANHSTNSKSDMNELLNIVIEFIFEWNVPFKRGYELLPKEDSWYLYQCCKYRKCAVCGKPAEIHHAINLVGMGNNRNKFNHLNSYFMALCRFHHNEIHNLGLTEFTDKYKVQPIKLDDKTLIKLNLMSVKQVREIKENEQ
ncbi:putative HNHc nuclease [Vagococcus carniphilus]|uniref:putative HNHc nuclease n=1 Tax=Vagococcus carniphilus TaxID=218144 RepID=UPI00288D2926|nr:putative HNHc nuclease [Vagococcus carniphilus]MDT2864658.1 putative HNHc nuclease [Vagococcus carniphilus]